MAKKVLKGIRVLEWGMLQQAPVAGAYLADLGAEVIKIESLWGDNQRQILSFYGQDARLPDGSCTPFEANNRNKKGISLDLKTEEGKQLLYRLVEKSDVFLTNFKPGVPERLGMGYADLEKVNPSIIYAYSTGYGIHGPDAGKGSMDMIGQARGGIMSSISTGDPNDPPGFVQGAIADQAGGICTAFGIVTALLARERFGIGQLVETNLLSALSNFNWMNVNQYGWSHEQIQRHNRTAPASALANYYQCKDGKWIMLGGYRPSDIKTFFNLVGKPEIGNDSKYSTYAGVSESGVFLAKAAQDVLITKNFDEWQKIFDDNGVVYAPVCTMEDLFNDPQMLENHGFYELKHPSREEKVKMVGAPFYLNKMPASVEKWAPKLGEDNRDLFSRLCGLSEEQLDDLETRGIIYTKRD